MAFDPHANFLFTHVAVAPSPATSGTTLTVTTADGTKLTALLAIAGSSGQVNVAVWPDGSTPGLGNTPEIVRITGVAGDVITIARQQEGSAARTIVVGDMIAVTITAKALTDLEQITPAYASVTKGAANVIPTMVFDANGRWSIAEIPITVPRFGHLRAFTHSYGSLSGISSAIGNNMNMIRRLAAVMNIPVNEVQLMYRAGMMLGNPSIGDVQPAGIGSAFRYIYPQHVYSAQGQTSPLVGGTGIPSLDVIVAGVNDVNGVGGVNGVSPAPFCNSATHGLRAVMAYWRARALYQSDDVAITYSGTWAQNTDKNYLPFAKYATSATINDYAEFTIPLSYKGGAIDFFYLGNPNARGTISAAITTTVATTVAMTSRTVMPASGNFVIQIDSEQMLVTAGQGTGAGNFTVTRGYNGTTAATHLINAFVFRPINGLYVDYSASTASCSQMTTLAPAMAGVNTSTFAGAGVVQTNGLPAGMAFQGHALIATATTTAYVSYSGISGNNLTGVTTISGGGVMSSGGSVGYATNLSGQGDNAVVLAATITGYDIQVVHRMTGLTAADAGLKIRATCKQLLTGEFFRPICVCIEDLNPPTQMVVNQPVPSTSTDLSLGKVGTIASFNTVMSNIAHEFPTNTAVVVDVASTFNAMFGATIQTATSTGTTIHVTPNDPVNCVWSKGTIIVCASEIMLITSAITKTSNTDWSFTVTRAYTGVDSFGASGAAVNHAVGEYINDLSPWSTIDGLHPSDLGHALYTASIVSALGGIPTSATKIATSGAYVMHDAQSWPNLNYDTATLPGYMYRPSVGNRGNATLTINKEWAEPFFVPQDGVITQLSCRITTGGAASTVRYGIYNDVGGGPGNNIFDSGVAPGPGPNASTGTNVFATAVFMLPVKRGWYWRSVVAQGTTAPVAMAANAGSPPPQGYIIPDTVSNMATTHGPTGFSKTTAGALTDWASSSIVDDSNNFPLIYTGFEAFVTA